MSRLPRLSLRFFTHSCLILLVLSCTFSGLQAFAAKRTLAISETVYKEMQKAQLLGEEKKYREAEAVLNALFEHKLNH